jgi:peptidoglycan/LPS O-acetylase OafA/YrhL
MAHPNTCNPDVAPTGAESSAATSAVQPAHKSSRFYQPALDALRFFAFALVFCHHAPIYRQWYLPFAGVGAFGLPIFFCLSAYLIITLLLKEQDETNTVRLGSFAMRRMLRIWPLYFAVLGIGYGAGALWHSAYLSPHAMRDMSLMLGNLFAIHAGWAALATVAPLWSISLEEQFYVGVPLLAKIGGRRAIALICALAILTAYGVLGWLGARGALPMQKIWPNSFVQFQFFAAGGWLALFNRRHTVRLGLAARLLLVAGALACYYVASEHFGVVHWTVIPAHNLIAGYLLVLIGTTAILLAMLNYKGSVPGWLIYLGKISYGLYLFHNLVMWLIFYNTDGWPHFVYYVQNHRYAGMLLVILITLGAASFSYRFFEKPFLRLKNRFETVKTRPI